MAPCPLPVGDVTIEILHPGDEIGEGLVRHCTFRVPRYLLSGGWAKLLGVADRGQSSSAWKYDAVGKPLWSIAEGRTRLEDLGGGRTRLPLLRDATTPSTPCSGPARTPGPPFILKDNDRLIAAALNEGLRRRRAARGGR